ncbi:MAG TPA: tRNA lysidine(34) synthetase TilS [Bacteroidales bacterium]|jgi:tRNA(Ile)-lysidine synthase|nr:tRNA lysidine(34) synthetase TilS [Bacteroidales bacterium]
MLAGIYRFIEENHMITTGGQVLLAVSGGIDSMVMSHLFLHLPYRSGIAHCNFSLRGEESDGDEELVRGFCTDHDIPLYSVRFDTQSYAQSKGISIQMAARDLRYNWFEEIRSRNNYDHIAVAHNLNDNIETLLLNLTRGTGLAGLSGMKPVSGMIIRPLLFATREKIVEYQKLHSVTFREDRSNSDTKYSRNKIRHLVIPVLKDINPSIEHTLAETAERFSGLNGIVGQLMDEVRTKVLTTMDETTVVNINALQEFTGNKTIMFELFRPYGFTNKVMNDVLNVISGQTGGQLFSETHRVIKDRESLIITRASGSESYSEVVIDGITGFQNNFASVELSDRSGIEEIRRERSIACLDADKIIYPVILRKWKEGDYFHPFGMKGRKKLSDYFTDKKYSLPEKEKMLVLESDGRIMWIVGDRIDDRFKVTDETKRILILKS